MKKLGQNPGRPAITGDREQVLIQKGAFQGKKYHDQALQKIKRGQTMG
jgi:hypothetical protein